MDPGMYLRFGICNLGFRFPACRTGAVCLSTSISVRNASAASRSWSSDRTPRWSAPPAARRRRRNVSRSSAWAGPPTAPAAGPAAAAARRPPARDASKCFVPIPIAEFPFKPCSCYFLSAPPFTVPRNHAEREHITRCFCPRSTSPRPGKLGSAVSARLCGVIAGFCLRMRMRGPLRGCRGLRKLQRVRRLGPMSLAAPPDLSEGKSRIWAFFRSAPIHVRNASSFSASSRLCERHVFPAMSPW